MLKYVENKEIDRVKWDSLIQNSKNGYIYSASEYLDIVCANWDALIYGDYEIIMPLPYKKKFGIKYIMQPIFAQQLGIIYKEKPSEDVFLNFFNFLNNSFLYYAINLNFDNIELVKSKYIEKTNLILNLNKPYEILYKNFSTNTKRNISKSKKEGFFVDIKTENSKQFIDFFVSNIETEVTENTISILENIIEFSFKKGIGEIHYVIKDNDLLASVFILKSYNSYIYLAATSSKKGKELRAMFFLLNNIILTKSSFESVLDFEGSDIQGVKRFYKGFGAENNNYNHIFKKFF